MQKFFKLIIIVLFAMASSGLEPEFIFAAASPELPRLYVDASPVTPSGKTIEVKSGDNLQAAIDSASYGDQIILESGATWIGSFTLKKKSGSGFIIIRSSNVPTEGVRVNPARDSAKMAKIKSPGSSLPALKTDSGASGYRIIGIEFGKSKPADVVTNLILLGNEERTEDLLPKNIILDRIYAHGDPTSNLRRCIALNGAYLAVIDSYISDCHEVGADSQAIAGWNGSGPFKIENNYLEGAGENIMFGGADPKIANLVPSDIEIKGNHFFKPLSWKIGDPSYAGIAWTVKNLFETKNAKRVLVEGNTFENSWTHAQTGTAILIKSANQSGGCAWCVSEDIIFRNNTVRSAAEGVRISAAEGSPRPMRVNNIRFENMTFDVSGKLFQIFNGAENVTFESVTGYSPYSILLGDGGQNLTNPRLVIKNSVLERGNYGIGTGSEEGTIYLDKWFPGWTFENNTIINSGSFSNDYLAKRYPAGTKIVNNKSEAVVSVPVEPPTPPTPPDTPQNPVTVSSRSSGGGGGGGGSSRSSRTTSGSQTIQELQAQLNFLLAQLAVLKGGNYSGVAVGGYTSEPTAFTSNLTLGSTGSQVVSLQQMLVSKGFLIMPTGVAYGYFGNLTQAAVAKWQMANGVSPAAGYWGPISRAKFLSN